jgi:tetrahydromethanopterin S-methyltransferase subunit G
MATLGERMPAVEGDVREHQVRIDDVRDELGKLRQDMNRQFESVDRRIDSIDHRFDLLDAKVSRQFVWLVGVQVMTLAAVVTSLATILSAVSGH